MLTSRTELSATQNHPLIYDLSTVPCHRQKVKKVTAEVPMMASEISTGTPIDMMVASSLPLLPSFFFLRREKKEEQFSV
jgi:hypothetical protein